MPNHRKIATLSALALAGLSTFNSSARADTHSDTSPAIPGVASPPMQAKDLITMPRVGTPIVTPFGRTAVFSVTQTDPETYEREAAHYALDLVLPGAKPVPVELGMDGFGLAFGADEHLYFLSAFDPDPDARLRVRLWRIAFQGGAVRGEASLVADMPGADIQAFELSPDAKRVALVGEIARDCPTFGCEGDAESLGSGKLYDGADGFYRHWDRWLKPGHFNRVFVFDLEDGAVIGEGVALDGADAATGITGNTPTLPFGGNEDLVWAPDGSGIYFVARETGANEPFSTDLDIYFSDLSSGAPKALTAPNEAHDSMPAPSPDGKTLVTWALHG